MNINAVTAKTPTENVNVLFEVIVFFFSLLQVSLVQANASI